MGKAELRLRAPGTKVDRGYIGESVPRPNAQRLLQGRGAFTDDLRFPRLAHVAYFRSPYAHALVKKLDFSAARRAEGVIAVLAADVRAGEPELLAQEVDQMHARRDAPRDARAVDRQCGFDSVFHARESSTLARCSLVADE